MARYTQEEIQVHKEFKRKFHFKTTFNFLKSHNSWRPSKLHTFLGVAHGGKSTLVRSLIIDTLEANPEKQVGLVLSEENEIDFLSELGESGFYKTEKLNIIEELGLRKGTVAQYFSMLDIYIQENKIKLLFIDNLTTSFVYMDRTIDQQAQVQVALKNLAIKHNIPIVLIMHTGANVSERHEKIITMNDVRGNKGIVNLSEFFYIMQSFFTEKGRFNTLTISKHRGQQVDCKLYVLEYHTKGRVFGDDFKIDFKALKEVYKNREKL